MIVCAQIDHLDKNRSLWPSFVGRVAFQPTAIHSSYSMCEAHQMSLGSNIWGLFLLNSKSFFTVEMCSSWIQKTKWEIERVNIRHEKTGWDWTSPIQWTKCIRNWFPPLFAMVSFPLWCWEERLCIEINSSKERESAICCMHLLLLLLATENYSQSQSIFFSDFCLKKERKKLSS